MSQLDIEHLRTWIGRSETLTELLAPAPATLLAATLDHPELATTTGDPLPPLFQWLYFMPVCPQSQIGADGHPARGGFLPPVPLPRRMWAASAIDFRRPLLIGSTASRHVEIIDLSLKQGRSGMLVFVKLRIVIKDGEGRIAIEETQDLVYRNHPAPDEPVPAPTTAPTDEHWARTVVADPVLLFRYSALTFNSHRIHYDLEYARRTEGYPALVVQGPLTVSLLLDHLQRNLPGRHLAQLTFRAVRPLFEGVAFELCGRLEEDGKTVSLWTRDRDGALCTHAIATIE